MAGIKGLRTPCPDCGAEYLAKNIKNHLGNKTCQVTATRQRYEASGRRPVPKKWAKALSAAGVLFVQDLAVIGQRYTRQHTKSSEQLYVPLWAWFVLDKLKTPARVLIRCSALGEDFCAAIATRYLMDGPRGAIEHLDLAGVLPVDKGVLPQPRGL